MSTVIDSLVSAINNAVKANGNKEITGNILQVVLDNMVGTLTQINGLLNVNQVNSKSAAYASASDARQAVPDNLKTEGLVIAYKLSSGWFIEQNKDISGTWTADSSWQTLAPVSVPNTEDIGYISKNITQHNVAISIDAKKGYQLTFSISNRDGEAVVLSKTAAWDASTNKTVITNGSSDVSVSLTLDEDFGYVWLSGGNGSPVLVVRNTKSLYESIIDGDDNERNYANQIKALITGAPTSAPAADYSYTIGAYINKNTGARVSAGNTIGATDYIALNGARAVNFLAYVSGESTTVAGYAFYDKNKKYLSGGSFTGTTSHGEDKTIEVPQNAACFIRFTVYSSAGAGYCNLITLSPQPLTDVFGMILPKIYKNDIYFNVGESIFNYPSTSVTPQTTINDELEEVADPTHFTSEIISVQHPEGLWKMYVNNDGEIADAGAFRLTLYSGETPIISLHSESVGNFPICITKDYVEANSIDGIRFTGPTLQNWDRLIVAKVGKYDIWNSFKKDYINNYGINLAFFAREDGESDDTGRINRALSLAMFGGTVIIPAGEYIISSTIHVAFWQHIQMEDGAVIKAADTFSGDTMVVFNGGGQFGKGTKYWTTNRWWTVGEDGNYSSLQMAMNGGTIDAMGKANCLSITGFKNFQLCNMQLRNGKNIGLLISGTLSSYEMMASKIQVINTIGGNSGNVGVKITNTDNHLSDVVVVDFTTGFLVQSSSNRLTRCHHWNGPAADEEYIADSISFDIQSPDNVLTDCYADTSEINYKFGQDADSCRMVGCGSFSNTSIFTVTTCTHIYNDGDYLAVIGCRLGGGVSPGGTLIPLDGSTPIWQCLASTGAS